jgi:hypothetical protein
MRRWLAWTSSREDFVINEEELQADAVKLISTYLGYDTSRN